MFSGVLATVRFWKSNYTESNKMKKIIAIHLHNDFSGSPLVLANVIRGMQEKGTSVELFTNYKNSEGFLSGIKNLKQHHLPYKWSNNKLITLFSFFGTQVVLFVKLFRFVNQDVIIYVNTILPFGAALAGRLMGKKVVYHIHETSVKPMLLKHFLFRIANSNASEAIYVSNYLLANDPLEKPNCHVVYNALSDQFVNDIRRENKNDKTFNVLMICSHKTYKGINEFVHLAMKMPHLNFKLVLNTTSENAQIFKDQSKTCGNLEVYPAQKNVHSFYGKANIVLNLSHTDQWIETFGMTALEAMAYGLPVIVPPVGGIAEIVENGVTGLHIDSKNIDKIKDEINSLIENKTLYNLMCYRSHFNAKKFSVNNQVDKIERIFYSSTETSIQLMTVS